MIRNIIGMKTWWDPPEAGLFWFSGLSFCEWSLKINVRLAMPLSPITPRAPNTGGNNNNT
jgi:hypothetical protein